MSPEAQAHQRPPPGLEPTRKPKRVKIDVACDTCRARKIKCDGLRPACGNCSKKAALREHCTYSHGGPPGPTSRGSLGLDLTTSNGHGNNDTGDRLSNYDSHHDLSPINDRSTLTRPAARAFQRPTSVSNTSPLDRSTGDVSSSTRPAISNISPSVIDSMTAVVDEGTRTREYFGRSSAGSFTAQIRKAIEAKVGQNNQYFPQKDGAITAHTLRAAPTTAPVINDAHRVLPTRRQADHLLHLYWTYVDPLYPFLDRPKWEESYRGIFNGTSINVEEHTFLATLNVIFALSSQLLESQTPEQRDESSNVYFNRAQALLPLNTWDEGSIELVQYLLLTSQYLQSTDRPHQTWMTVGSAVRIAQGLGLHLCETSANHPDANERELFRRIWYGCVLMDRMVAVTHGRPSMISPCLANIVPMPVYPDTIDSHTSNQGVFSTDASFFVKSVELYEIIHRTVRTLYDGTGSRSKNVTAADSDPGSDEEQIDLGMVMQLDSALGKWERKLPVRLRYLSTQARGEVTQRQATILYIRFLHARILLLRPILASFCLAPQSEAESPDTLESRVLRECALLCVSTAQSVISALLKHQTVDGTVGLLPAWWYRVYYVYTAATVLIAAKLRSEVFSGADLSRSWSQAMSVLKSHEKFGQSARRCVAALHFLSAKMKQDGGGEHSGRTSRGDFGQDSHVHGMAEMEQAPLPEDFTFSFDGLDNIGFQDVDFDVNGLAWLNDMHATWELLNHG